MTRSQVLQSLKEYVYDITSAHVLKVSESRLGEDLQMGDDEINELKDCIKLDLEVDVTPTATMSLLDVADAIIAAKAGEKSPY